MVNVEPLNYLNYNIRQFISDLDFEVFKERNKIQIFSNSYIHSKQIP